MLDRFCLQVLAQTLESMTIDASGGAVIETSLNAGLGLVILGVCQD